MASTDVIQQHLTTERKFFSLPDLFFQKHLNTAFLEFLKNQNGNLSQIEKIKVVQKQSNGSVENIQKHVLFIANFNLNYVRNPNSYLRDFNYKLKESDLLAGRIELMEGKHRKLKKEHPFAYRLFILNEFIFKRLLPRLPLFRDLFNGFSLIKKMILSKCEILGRLIYNGFEICSIEEAGESLYFLVKKSEEPRAQKVNRGIVFKQRRVGKGGRPFNFFKLRTMHPYAEFVQTYLMRANDLNEKGKVKDDFRIADWGRFLRRNWLDELPGILNLIRGDIRLFGVRPLSRAFFDIYPEDLKKERIKMKPGLIPPYYSDLPNSIDEVIESERRYLERRKKAPLKTDVEYFLKAMNNILLKGARSS